MCYRCEQVSIAGEQSSLRTSEHLRVEKAMQEIADARGIKLLLGSRVGYTDPTAENEPPYYGAAARDGSAIRYFYDPLPHSPENLWWGFLHELGHIEQWHSQDHALRAAHEFYWNEVIEPDAWNRAERMAKLSPWPPTAEFYRQRDHALASYGLAA